MSSYDVIIKNAKIVTANGTFKGNIGIEEGRIKTLSASSLSDASEVINSEGKVIVPGVIDPHQHLVMSSTGEKPFEQIVGPNSASMATGGVTSAFTFVARRDSYDKVLKQLIRSTEQRSFINFGIHVSIWNMKQVGEMEGYAKEYGVTDFKFHPGAGEAELYPNTFGSSDGTTYMGFQRIAELGYPVTAMVHAENWDIFFVLRDKLTAEGRTSQSDWTDMKPTIIEVEGISRSLIFAKHHNCRVYFPHVSSSDGSDLIRKARAEGVKVEAETCPHYLSISRHDKFDFKATVNPSLKEKSDNQAIWKALERGTLSCLASDHTPNKRASSGIILPLLLSEGVNKGRLSLERLVEVTSLKSAKWFGLYPQKGTLLPGSDADLVVVDMKKVVKVTQETLRIHKIPLAYSWFEGWTMKGWPILTMVGGNIVMKDGELTSKPGSAKYLRRHLGRQKSVLKN